MNREIFVTAAWLAIVVAWGAYIFFLGRRQERKSGEKYNDLAVRCIHGRKKWQPCHDCAVAEFAAEDAERVRVAQEETRRIGVDQADAEACQAFAATLEKLRLASEATVRDLESSAPAAQRHDLRECCTTFPREPHLENCYDALRRKHFNAPLGYLVLHPDMTGKEVVDLLVPWLKERGYAEDTTGMRIDLDGIRRILLNFHIRSDHVGRPQ